MPSIVLFPENLISLLQQLNDYAVNADKILSPFPRNIVLSRYLSQYLVFLTVANNFLLSQKRKVYQARSNLKVMEFKKGKEITFRVNMEKYETL